MVLIRLATWELALVVFAVMRSSSRRPSRNGTRHHGAVVSRQISRAAVASPTAIAV
jgi:hypothetical protein